MKFQDVSQNGIQTDPSSIKTNRNSDSLQMNQSFSLEQKILDTFILHFLQSNQEIPDEIFGQWCQTQVPPTS